MRILVTGVAGFIGMHVASRLIGSGYEVIGIDSLNDYYDPGLKRARLSHIGISDQFSFTKLNICDSDKLNKLFADRRPSIVINLAAQAGVRYSIENPKSYVDSNLVGFVNILESCRNFGVEHFVYGSSSSVYGLNSEMPFKESQKTDRPASLYGATKKANELIAHSYSHLFGLPTTGLRFFTVYGPWGRPDMAPMIFANAILKGERIEVFNHGKMKRDFTFIDDVVEGICRVALRYSNSSTKTRVFGFDDKETSDAFNVFNIGNGKPVELMSFISELEKALGRTANKVFLPLQDGDVISTHADTKTLEKWINFSPKTPLSAGIREFSRWLLDFDVK